MKKNESTNKKAEKSSKFPLEGYYDSLPEASFPKTEFVNETARDCGVSVATVHNWMHGKTKPEKPEHRQYLCKKTGLKEEEIWKE